MFRGSVRGGPAQELSMTGGTPLDGVSLAHRLGLRGRDSSAPFRRTATWLPLNGPLGDAAGLSLGRYGS